MSSDHWTGRVIDGRYVVEATIGHGGMGVVLKARHRFTGAQVALKMLQPNLVTNQEAQDRFLAEARAPSTIGHPGIVQVLDAGKTPEGELYLAMELLVGRTLRHAMYPSLPQSVARRILLELLDALAAAHARGIIHRDLKPENVYLVGPAETVKLLDFGIAKVVERSTHAAASTAAGMMLGTLSYMAPEQLSDARSVDLRADLWAVGVLLYEMLSGKLPFRGTHLSELMLALATKDPDPIAMHMAVTPPITAFFERALARDRESRFASAHEMALAISALPIGGTRPVAAQPRDTVATGWPPGTGVNAAVAVASEMQPPPPAPIPATQRGMPPSGFTAARHGSPATPPPSGPAPYAHQTPPPMQPTPGAFSAAQPAMQQPGAYSAAQPAMQQPGAYSAAQPAMQQPGAYSAAQPAMQPTPGAYSAAQPAMQQPAPGAYSAAQPAMHQPGAYSAAQPAAHHPPTPAPFSAVQPAHHPPTPAPFSAVQPAMHQPTPGAYSAAQPVAHHPPTPAPFSAAQPAAHHPPTPAPFSAVQPAMHQPTPGAYSAAQPAAHHPPTPTPFSAVQPAAHHPPTPAPFSAAHPAGHHPPTPAPFSAVQPAAHHPPTPGPYSAAQHHQAPYGHQPQPAGYAQPRPTPGAFPGAHRPAGGVPLWVWLAIGGGVLVLTLIGVGIAMQDPDPSGGGESGSGSSSEVTTTKEQCEEGCGRLSACTLEAPADCVTRCTLNPFLLRCLDVDDCQTRAMCLLGLECNGAEPRGGASCTQTMQCAATCANNQQCMCTQCITNMAPAHALVLARATLCALSSCSGQGPDCMMQNCRLPLEACLTQ